MDLKTRAMKGTAALFWIVAGIAAFSGAQVPESLPGPVRSALDRMHPGWRVGAVGADVRAADGRRLGRTPNIVFGDFDSDGRRDVAVLIEYGNVDQTQKSFTHYIEVFAFLNRAGGYEAIRLTDQSPGPDPRQYLTLQRRGDRGLDFETGKRFTYPHDSIGLWFFEKAGGTYIYDNGKFRYVAESD
jgi:hypothetical protein